MPSALLAAVQRVQDHAPSSPADALGAVQGAAPIGAHGGPDITPFIWLLLAATVVAMFAQRLRVPYALALVVTGLLLGAPQILQQQLEPHILFTIFLPPLLFESALNLRLELLRSNLKPILIYAAGGTLISTLAVGGLCHWLLGLPLPAALVFGALISPTDPISVIALFKKLGVGKRLAVMVEAESLFNDGVAVVLFSVFLTYATGGDVTIVDGLVRFVVVVAGGAIVGAAIGAAASHITGYFDDHLLEIMLTTIVAYGAYLVAEAMHVSGVIAVVMAGLMVGNHGMVTGMSPTTRLAVASFWEYAAFAANSIVFLLIGIEVTFFNLWDELGPIAVAVATVLAGRGLAIYGLGLLVNRVRGDVPMPYQHVFFWGGLRGALSMALALGISSALPERNSLIVLTFGVVLFSLLVQGLTVERLLSSLGLTSQSELIAGYRKTAALLLAARAGLDELEKLHGRHVMARQDAEDLESEYRDRVSELERQIEAMHVSDAELLASQGEDARRRILLAEKSALQDVHRRGMLTDDQLHELEADIDGRLMPSGAMGGH